MTKRNANKLGRRTLDNGALAAVTGGVKYETITLTLKDARVFIGGDMANMVAIGGDMAN